MSSSWSVPSPAYCSSIWLTNRHQRSIWLPELSPLPTSGKETQWGTRAYSSLTKHCCEVCSASGTCLLPPASTKAQEEENPQHLAGSTAGPEAVHEDAPELLSRRLPSRILVKSEFVTLWPWVTCPAQVGAMLLQSKVKCISPPHPTLPRKNNQKVVCSFLGKG